MYKIFLETLSQAGITLPVWVFRVILVIVVIIGLGVFYNKYLKDKIKVLKRVKEDISNDAVGEIKRKTEENVKILEGKIDAVQKSSDEGDKKLGEQIELINGKVDQIITSIGTLTKTIDDMQVKSDKQERSRLKDRIGELYAIYHKRGYWNSLEKEALQDLIKSYERAGGKNSYVHSIVEPEMYLWDLRD